MRVALPTFPVDGGCVCGAVRYRVKAAPVSCYGCHCKDCQRFSGAGYSTAIGVRLADFEMLRGAPARFAKPADSGRTVGVRFCRDCGTRLYHEPAHSPQLVMICGGTLDDMSWATPVAHIWTSRKLPWIGLESDVLQIEGQPADRAPLHEAWVRAIAEY